MRGKEVSDWATAVWEGWEGGAEGQVWAARVAWAGVAAEKAVY